MTNAHTPRPEWEEPHPEREGSHPEGEEPHPEGEEPHLEGEEPVRCPQQHFLEDIEPVENVDRLATLRQVILDEPTDPYVKS